MNWWENDLPSGASSGTDRVSQFTATYRPLAEKIGQEIGVSPDILLAKFGSETGWGKSVIPGTNNLGNIKDPSGRGVYATDNMTKSRDAYRVFDTPEDFGTYYTDFIKRSYPKAVGAGSDPMAFAQGLKEGVRGSYAEDPEYGPKIARATNMVTKGNTASDAGAWWSNDLPATSSASGGEQWWANDLPAPAKTQAAPLAPPQAAAKAPTPEKKKDEPRSVLRRVDDFVRGVADTVTFGYADEIAGKLDSLVGGGQSGKTTYKDAVAAQRQRDTEGGAERIAGQIGGAFVPGAAAVGAVRAVPTAGRLARAGAGAATGAIQGGLYGSGSAEEGQRLEGAATGAAIGAATGGILGGVLPASQAQKSTSFIKKSGDDAAARMDAEIITDIKKIADSSTKRGNPVSTIDLNAVENKYINDVNRAVTALGKSDKTFDAGPLRAALQDRRALTPDALAPLRSSSAGNAVADAIEKAQRARSLTQAAQSSGGVLPLIREAVDFLPIPAAAHRGLKAALGGRQTREVAAQKVLKQAGTAEDVLSRLGPSQASQSLQGLNTTVEKAVASRQAQVEAAKLAAQAKAAQDATTKLQVLKDTRRPLSGAFQELLPGGASNLNLSSKEAIDALRLVSRQQKEGPVGTAAMEILRSGNVVNKDAFYGLQNQLRKLQEQGVLAGQPGALTSASSGVRNPVSYAEAVRTAGEAANLARASAPNKELAQFATKVAGIKSPADKAKAIADRLAKSNDPAEQAFLTQFVEPLAQFGKK